MTVWISNKKAGVRMRIKTNQELKSRVYLEKVFVYDPKTDRIAQLNLSTAMVLDKCQTEKSFDELIGELRKEFPKKGREDLKQSFAKVVKTLLEKNFLELAE
ncbi:MAG: PqqD family peptide modification chaperone [Candidatus Diapherotrites archaeon]